MAKKKILMRTGLSPFENLSEKVISDENLFGNNVGNLLYAFSHADGRYISHFL